MDEKQGYAKGSYFIFVRSLLIVVNDQFTYQQQHLFVKQ